MPFKRGQYPGWENLTEAEQKARRKANAKYRYTHKQYLRDKALSRRQVQRDKAIEYLGGKCKDCGIKDERVFQFDHLSPRDGFPIASKISMSWENLRKELDKCELVCANCHQIRTKERLKERRSSNRAR